MASQWPTRELHALACASGRLSSITVTIGGPQGWQELHFDISLLNGTHMTVFLRFRGGGVRLQLSSAHGFIMRAGDE